MIHPHDCYMKLVRDRQQEIGRLAEGVPSEITKLSKLNVGEYYETSSIAFIYRIEKNKEEEARTEKLKNKTKTKKR